MDKSTWRSALWIGWVITALISAAGLPRCRVDNSMDAWMPDLVTAWRYPSYVVVGMGAPQIDVAALARRLRTLSSVAVVVDPASAQASSLITGVTTEDFVVGKDGVYRGLFCFRTSAASDRELIEKVQSALPNFGPRDAFAVGGPAAFHVAMDQWSQQRIAAMVAVILGCGGAMLYWISGSVRLAAIAMTAIALSQIIFVGALGWMRIPLDMALAMVPPMMTGLGFSYAAHRALRRQSMMALVLCVVAACVGIASFATADLLPVRHFAQAGVPALLLTWLVTVSLVRPDHKARQRRVDSLRAARRTCVHLVARHSGTILCCAAGITLISIAVSPRLRIQTDPLRFFPEDSQIARDFALLDRRLTGMLPSHVIVQLPDRNLDARPILAATPGMRKVIDVSAWTAPSSRPGGQRTYLCLADDDAVTDLAARVPTWQAWALANGGTLQWHGVAAQIHRSGQSIRLLAAASLPSMTILIAALIAALFRDLRMALAAAWVCLLPVAVLLVVAVLFELRVGPITLMIGSITAGVAVDDTIHLLTTFRRRGSLRRALVECWKPCVGSSLAASFCFGLFILSPFGPTKQFGLLMALATLFAMLANQLVLAPSLSLPVTPLVKRGASTSSNKSD